MKYGELKEGGIYYCRWAYGGYEYIFRKGSPYSECIELKEKKYHLTADFSGSGAELIRDATDEEKKHFLLSKKEGKYIEPNQLISDLLIFN